MNQKPQGHDGENSSEFNATNPRVGTGVLVGPAPTTQPPDGAPAIEALRPDPFNKESAGLVISTFSAAII